VSAHLAQHANRAKSSALTICEARSESSGFRISIGKGNSRRTATNDGDSRSRDWHRSEGRILNARIWTWRRANPLAPFRAPIEGHTAAAENDQAREGNMFRVTHYDLRITRTKLFKVLTSPKASKTANREQPSVRIGRFLER
jgi:hypothetical protein